jgi:hypothetical protein
MWRAEPSVLASHSSLRILTTALVPIQLLVIERLDHILTVTHQRGSSAATPLSTFTAHTQSSTEKQQPAPASVSQHHQHQQVQQRPLPSRPAPPVPSSRSLPTPPSTSPPDFVHLPAVRNAALPPKRPPFAAHASEESRTTAPGTSTAASGRLSTSIHSASSLAHIALPPLPASNSTHGRTSTPRSQPASLSEFATQQRALGAQAANGRSKVSNSGFISDPDEMYDTSVNALQLSTSSSSSRKRGREEEDESDPDEEVLHFGQQTRQIKRVKTSQSPASGSDTTPLAVPDTTHRSTSGATAGYNSSYTSPFGVRSEAPLLIHGHSPLAQSFSPNDEPQEQPPPLAQVQYVQDDDEEEEEEENSDSDSDSTDSEDEVSHPPIQQDTYVYTVPDPNPIVYHNEEEEDSDEDEEDDFLMQALGESGHGVDPGSGAVTASGYYTGDDGESNFRW